MDGPPALDIWRPTYASKAESSTSTGMPDSRSSHPERIFTLLRGWHAIHIDQLGQFHGAVSLRQKYMPKLVQDVAGEPASTSTSR